MHFQTTENVFYVQYILPRVPHDKIQPLIMYHLLPQLLILYYCIIATVVIVYLDITLQWLIQCSKGKRS